MPITIELLRVGPYGGRAWRAADLDALARNHATLRGFISPPLTTPDRPILAGQTDGHVSIGWVERLRGRGDVLLAELAGVPTVVAQALKAGTYTGVEVSTYPEFSTTSWETNLQSGVQGPVVASVGLRGLDVPEVRTLDDLGRFLHAEDAPVRFTTTDDELVTLVAGDVVRGEVKDAMTLNERIRRAEHALNLLSEGQDSFAELCRRADANIDGWRELKERAGGEKVRMGGLSPEGATTVGLGEWVTTAMDACESRIQYERGDRSDPATRRRALDAVLGRDPHLAARLNRADRRAIVEGFAVNDAVDEGFEVGLEPRKEATGGTLAKGSLGGQGEREVFGESEPPLYGGDSQLASELAGTGSYAQGCARKLVLTSIAHRRGLDLSRTADHRLAMTELHSTVNPGRDLRKALTFEEGLYCISGKLTFAEAEARRPELARELARKAPHLCNEGYGTRPDDGHDDEAVKLAEEAAQLCRDQDVAATPINLARARLAILRLRGGGDYGTN